MTYLVALFVTMVMLSSFALADDRLRLECRADSATEDASASARFETRGETARTRKKFDVEFEAAPGASFQAGDVLNVIVDGDMIGQIELTQVGLDIGGQINFDATAQPDDDDLPFPEKFPDVAAGTIVQVGGEFSCSLQER